MTADNLEGVDETPVDPGDPPIVESAAPEEPSAPVVESVAKPVVRKKPGPAKGTPRKPRTVRVRTGDIANVEVRSEPVPAPPGKKVLHVHFLTDGMTVLGKVMYRGEEIYVVEGSAEYAELEHSKLHWDADRQIDEWNEIRFAPGKWPFKGYDSKSQFDPGLMDPNTNKPYELTPSEAAQLEAANKARNLQAAR